MPCFNFAHTSSYIIILHNISYSFLSLTVIEGFRNQYIGEITLFVTLAFPCFSTFQLGPVTVTREAGKSAAKLNQATHA
jgi:hypothetical protein